MILLPKQFAFLNEIGVLPKLVSAGLQYLGVREIKGTGSNPAIMDMAAGLGVADIFTDDDMAWCAVFLNHLLRITGKPLNLVPKDKYDLLRALKTADLFDVVPKEEWLFGDVVRLKRKGGGHVFIAIAGTNKNTIWGLGGNQKNEVRFDEFDMGRIESVRRHYSIAPPASAKQYIITASGKLSENEI